MKKAVIYILSAVLFAAMFAACNTKQDAPPEAVSQTDATKKRTPVKLDVVTTYGREDGNRGIYEEGIRAWEDETGNTVMDASASADEAWKLQVMNDFEAGSEPDVLFFYAFTDGDPLVNGNKVVSIEEIRAEYPDYASNMNYDEMPASTANGKNYCVPTSGFWEGIFTNNTVLAKSGVEMPGKTTTWDEFLDMCQQIKDAGYIPVAMGREVPHYWFEFLILNEAGMENHLAYPGSSDEARQAWIDALANFALLYERGFLPDNYLTLNNDEARMLVVEGKAAFIGEGSWAVGWFERRANPNDITVTFPPGSNIHPASQIIGGTSMGYYITRKAWDDPQKREAAVSFVSYMTNDDIVSRMSQNNMGSNALKNNVPLSDGSDSVLRETGYSLAMDASGMVGSVQDLLAGSARDNLFSTIPDITAGWVSPEVAVDQFIEEFGAKK